MKVFISWSGERSRELAELLRDWIPGVVQAAKPYFTPDDITKGTRWSNEISNELAESSIGIICLTGENLEAPWIMFEAGALSKNLDKSKVCPILFGPEPTDIKGPLVQFQAAPFARKEMKRVVQMLNKELGEQSLASSVLDSVFEMWWPRLEEKVQAVLSAEDDGDVGRRTDRDILEEVLSLSRSASRGRLHTGRMNPRAISDLTRHYRELVETTLAIGVSDFLGDILRELLAPIQYFSRQGTDEDIQRVAVTEALLGPDDTEADAPDEE